MSSSGSGEGENTCLAFWHIRDNKNGSRRAAVVGVPVRMSIVFPQERNLGAKVVDLGDQCNHIWNYPCSAHLTWPRFRKRKREMVEGLCRALSRYKASGSELVMGRSELRVPRRLDVRLNDGGTRTLTGERIFLKLGTVQFPSGPGLAESGPLTILRFSKLDRSRTPTCARGWLCRPRIRSGLSSLWKSGDDS